MANLRPAFAEGNSNGALTALFLSLSCKAKSVSLHQTPSLRYFVLLVRPNLATRGWLLTIRLITSKSGRTFFKVISASYRGYTAHPIFPIVDWANLQSPLRCSSVEPFNYMVLRARLQRLTLASFSVRSTWVIITYGVLVQLLGLRTARGAIGGAASYHLAGTKVGTCSTYVD